MMEFSEDKPDFFNNIPHVGATAYRETLGELNIVIDPSKIRWIGVGATYDRCEPFITGVCKISDRKNEIARKAIQGYEQREICEEYKTNFRRKIVRAIPIRNVIRKEDMNFGPLSFSLPIPLQITKNLKSLIRDKIIHRREKASFRTNEEWTDSGAASLLLCLLSLEWL